MREAILILKDCIQYHESKFIVAVAVQFRLVVVNIKLDRSGVNEKKDEKDHLKVGCYRKVGLSPKQLSFPNSSWLL